jgi:hypothetical protein
MKLYGSLTNRMMESSKQPAAIVGMGATLCHYSDRDAATVVRVSPSGKTIWLREDRSTRTDKNGQSEAQSYTYERDESAPEQKATMTRAGEWKIVNGPRVLLGLRQTYNDPNY